jgi:hypothetical protein
MHLADGPRDNVDVQLAGEGLVAGEVGLRLGAGGEEGGVVWAPGGEVVFWEDG